MASWNTSGSVLPATGRGGTASCRPLAGAASRAPGHRTSGRAPAGWEPTGGSARRWENSRCASAARTTAEWAKPGRTTPAHLGASRAGAASFASSAGPSLPAVPPPDGTLASLAARVSEVRSAADASAKEAELERLEKSAASEAAWEGSGEGARAAVARAGELRAELAEVWRVEEALEELELARELAALEEGEAAGPGGGESMAEGARALQARLEELLRGAEVRRLFDGPLDDSDAAVTVTAGAGGTDAADWAEMVLRMYSLWVGGAQEGRRGAGGRRDGSGDGRAAAPLVPAGRLSARLIDRQAGEEAGIRSATLEVTGPFAYALMRCERGTHRLVRRSPFHPKGLRQTSFCGVEVTPLPRDGDAPAGVGSELPEKEVEVTTMRASGAGGQHVNTTNSAVRVRHTPTGLTVRCEAERSQARNKQTALRLLRAKVLEREREETEARAARLRGAPVRATWGQQIRSYVLHPYELCKDVRTGVELTDVRAVLDGQLDRLVLAELERVAAQRRVEASCQGKSAGGSSI